MDPCLLTTANKSRQSHLNRQLMPDGFKYYFYPYQLPPTPYLRYSKLTGYGVVFLLVNYLLVRGERENKLWVIPRAAIQLMLGHVARSCWLRFWTRVSLRFLCAFSPIYILPPPPHSLISTLLIFEGKSSSPSFSPDCPLLPLAWC